MARLITIFVVNSGIVLKKIAVLSEENAVLSDKTHSSVGKNCGFPVKLRFRLTKIADLSEEIAKLSEKTTLY